MDDYHNDYKDDALPHALKSRLSKRWIKFIEMLALRSVSSTSAQSLLNDVQLKQACCIIGEAESWEEFLIALSVDDAVVANGNFRLQPLYLSLPTIVQTKLLYLIQHNASKICSHQLQSFVSTLESADVRDNLWVKDGVSRLQQHLTAEQTTGDDLSAQPKPKCYTFSSTSENLISGFVQNVLRKRNEELSSVRPTVVVDVSAQSSPYKGLSDLTSSCQAGQKVVDVIVINDEDSEDLSDLGTEYRVQHATKNMAASRYSVSNRPKEKSDTLLKGEEGSRNLSNPALSSILPVSTHGSLSQRQKKRKAAEMEKDSVDVECNNTALIGTDRLRRRILQDPEDESQAKAREISGAEHSCMEARDISSESKSVDIRDDVEVLTDNVKANLQKLQETWFGENKSSGFDTSKLKFLLELSPSQIKASCVFLQLGGKTEANLVDLCDVLPWSEMEQPSASALVTGCFNNKLLTLQAEASQTLQAALTSVLEGQPIVVLDLFIKAIHQTQDNTYQCHLLATLCKKVLSQESLCYLIRELNVCSVLVSESMCSVLQAVVDRRADLDQATLTSLVSLLSRASSHQDLVRSPRLGKCLMACLTKYGKKMTAENLVTFSSLVDLHGSSFKPALSATLKRLNK